MNAKLTALGLFAAAVFALPAQAEDQFAWHLTQVALTDGNTITSDEPAADHRKRTVRKVAGPVETGLSFTSDGDYQSEVVPQRETPPAYEPDFPISMP